MGTSSCLLLLSLGVPDGPDCLWKMKCGQVVVEMSGSRGWNMGVLRLQFPSAAEELNGISLSCLSTLSKSLFICRLRYYLQYICMFALCTQQYVLLHMSSYRLFIMCLKNYMKWQKKLTRSRPRSIYGPGIQGYILKNFWYVCGNWLFLYV